MSSSISIASSGLEAAGARLAVSASNIAHADVPGYEPRRVGQGDRPGGGVAAEVAPPPPPDAGAPGELRADRAIVATSGVDLAREMIEQARAARAWSASIKVLKTADEQAGVLAELVR